MRRSTIVLAAVCLAVPAPLVASAVPIQTAIAAVGGDRSDDDDGNPRLGLLGLLGLAGLLGLFRREPDIHVDARRDRQD